MKDKALQIAAEGKNNQDSYNKLREYLQHNILRTLFETAALDKIVFHGGTALRILHNLGRFSEDLDFHTRRNEEFNITRAVERIERNLRLQGYNPTLSNSFDGAVKSSFVKFKSILSETGLSRGKNERLNIKIEVDTNPPEGFKTDNSLINKYFPLALVHHNLSTFLAGKLHAILQRNYEKGRDYYDLFFYLGRWEDITPNFKYLNTALEQTGYEDKKITRKNWKEIFREKIKSVDWDIIISDVKPFIENRQDLKAFSREYLLKLLG